MAETQKNWYVLRAVSGKEAKVKEYIEAELKHNTLLQSHVFQVLIPMEKQASLRNGKRVEKEKISHIAPAKLAVCTFGIGASCSGG